MNLRKSIVTALLIGIGYILHQVVPGAVGGMKFDFMLAVIFVCLLINSDLKNAILTAFLGGMITALTTSFPGGQIPNIIDKMVTVVIVFGLIKLAGKHREKFITIGIIAFIGTIISGSAFLISALFLVGLPAPFTILFVTIVIPTAITNIFVTNLIYKGVKISLKATGMALQD